MTPLDKPQVRKMGKFDNAGRFELYPQFETETSRSARTPSRSWPLSVWKHCLTLKYRKSLSPKQCKELGVDAE